MNRRHFLQHSLYSSLFAFSAATGLTGCRPAATDIDQQRATPVAAGAETIDTAVTIPAPLEFNPDNPLLRYRFTQGKELRWNVQHTLKMRNIIGGMEENIETRSRAVKIWRTLDVDAAGTATFEYRVEDIDIHQAQTGHDDVFYNSRRDTRIPPELINLEGKIGIELAHIRIGPQGETTKKPLREYDGSVSENRIVIPLPDEPVEVGSRWVEPEQIDLPLPNQTIKKIRLQHNFTLTRILSGLATINFGTVIFTPLTPKEESQLLEHFTQGTKELDLQAGHFIRHEATIDRMVVGTPEASDSIRYQSRVTECCCSRRACEICNV